MSFKFTNPLQFQQRNLALSYATEKMKITAEVLELLKPAEFLLVGWEIISQQGQKEISRFMNKSNFKKDFSFSAFISF